MSVKIKDVTSGYIKEIETLKAENDGLKTERDALAAGLNLAKVVFDILFNLPDAKTKAQCEIEADTWLRLKAALDATPQQCLHHIQTEAVKKFVEFNTGRYSNAFDAYINDALKTYMASMNQGGE